MKRRHSHGKSDTRNADNEPELSKVNLTDFLNSLQRSMRNADEGHIENEENPEKQSSAPQADSIHLIFDEAITLRAEIDLGKMDDLIRKLIFTIFLAMATEKMGVESKWGHETALDVNGPGLFISTSTYVRLKNEVSEVKIPIISFVKPNLDEKVSPLIIKTENGDSLGLLDSDGFLSRFLAAIRESLPTMLTDMVLNCVSASLFSAMGVGPNASLFHSLEHVPIASLPKPMRGGDKRSKYQWTDERCISFAKKTKKLLPLWRMVANYFDRNDYDPGCCRAIKELDRFKELSQECTEVPDEVVNQVLLRRSKSGPRYRPLAFALEHASREIQIPYPFKYDTLNKAYSRGLKLLKQME